MAFLKKGDWVRAKDAYVAEHWNMYWADESGVTAVRDTVFKVFYAFAAGDTVTIGAGALNRGPTWAASRFEPWTPKVGERVRVSCAVDGRKVGCGATVVADDGMSTMRFLIEFDEIQEWAHDGGRPAKENRGRWVDEADIEPLPVAAEAQPAETDGGYDAWFSEKVKEAMDDTRTSIPHDEAMASIKARLSKSTPPAPLRIQTGKFYKTRDGRKVGPMVLSEYPWEAGAYRAVDSSRSITGQDWRIDGTFIVGSTSPLDLIAEWPADTTASDTTTNAAATVDAINDEYGPVATVADRDNDTVGLTVSLDTSELHEELDAVISKLKKIRKLQRELGLIAA